MTAGRGPDKCIDAAGAEPVPKGITQAYDVVRRRLRLTPSRTAKNQGMALHQAIATCRKGGSISVIGQYGTEIEDFPIGVAMNKGLTIRIARVNPQQYIPKLLELLRRDQFDVSYALTHELPLQKGAEGYELFRKRQDGCIRVVFTPAKHAN